MSKNPDIDTLLKRTTLEADQFDLFITQVEQEYPSLGKIQTIIPLIQGYEDANFTLVTENGRFVLKIFAEDMSITCAKAHAKILKLANTTGFPAVPILTNSHNEELTTILDNFCFITTYIDARSFNGIKPTLEDIVVVTHALAEFNTLTEKLSVSYDSWSNSELLWEYKRDKDLLSAETVQFLQPTINKMRLLDSGDFQTGLIHGDIQPNHVLKKDDGSILIIDFGVARNDLLIYELSTHLAWFCLPEFTIDDYPLIVETVVHTYEKSIQLSKLEKESLSVLIEAAYAAYFFRTEVLLTKEISEETKEWNRKAKSLLLSWRKYCSL